MSPNQIPEISQLGEQLKQTLYTTDGAPVRPSRLAFLRALARRSPVITVGCVLAGSAGVGIAVAATLSGGPVTFSQYHDGTRAQIATTVSSRFSVLNQPVVASDALPSSFVLTHEHSALVGALGANLKLAHRADGVSPGAVWVVPAASATCLMMSQSANGEISGTVCSDSPDVATGHLIATVGGPDASGGEFLAGLVPDGVDSVVLELADGSSQTLTVHDNVYTADITTSPATVQFTGPAGVETVAP